VHDVILVTSSGMFNIKRLGSQIIWKSLGKQVWYKETLTTKNSGGTHGLRKGKNILLYVLYVSKIHCTLF
jgi:hypothetical protein